MMNDARKLSRVMEVAAWVLMILDLALMIALPWITETLTSQPRDTALYNQYLVFLYVTGVIGELILWQCRGIMRNVTKKTPFCADTVKRLRAIGWITIALAVAWIVMISCFDVFKFLMTFLALLFAFIGLVLFVFAALFAQATAYKEENDMTI